MLTTAQKRTVERTLQVMVARTLERQLLGAARDVLAATEVTADPLVQAPNLMPPPPLPKHNDRAGLTNQMGEGYQDLDHSMKWLTSYFKALKPAIERFTRKMIKYDVSNMTQQHMDKLAGVVSGVLKLVELLDSAGATISDITEVIQTLEKQLKFKANEDARSLRRWF